MEKKHMLVSSITDTTKNWSAKVRVLTKLPIKTAISSPTKYQKMILADEMGNTVEAIIYKTDIDLYKNNLEVSKTYEVSNAQVSRVKDMYRNDLVSSLYQWTITSGTSVMPVVEDTISCTLFRPDFIRFHEFATFLGSRKTICTVCVIIEKNTPKKVMANNRQQILHEYAAIDQETPFVVTLWSDVVSEEIFTIINATHARPVLALLNFVVKGYYGLSLSSGSSSVVLTEMDNQIFTRMRKWLVDQQSFIDESIERGGFFEEKIGIRTGMAIPINTILEVLQADEGNLFNIKVKISLDDNTQSFIYMCCGECRRATNVSYNSLFRCNSCAVNMIAEPRFRFRVIATDDTSTLDITVFGKEGELILGMSAHTFYDLIVNDGIPPISSINQRVKDVTLFMKIKSSHFNGSNGRVTTTYNLLALEFADGFTGFEHPLAPDPDNQPLDQLVGGNISKGAKRKLNFCSTRNTTKKASTGFDFGKVADVSGVVNLSSSTRYLSKGKSKMTEREIAQDKANTIAEETFEESTHSVGSADTDSIDNSMTLSEIFCSNKVRRFSKKKTNMIEDLTQHDYNTYSDDALDGASNMKKGKLHNRNARQVVLDDSSSEDDLRTGSALVQLQTPGKEPACQTTSIKTSTRGRVLKPKKFF